MAELKASWDLHLWADCPHCKESVDLLDYVDFWDGVPFQAVEHGTAHTTDRTVTCPSCMEEFVVDFEY